MAQNHGTPRTTTTPSPPTPPSSTSTSPELPGIVRRTLTAGEKVLLIEFTLEPGAVVPMHTHPHEQAGYVVSGRMRLQIGAETLDLDPGDAYMIPGGAEHEASALDQPLVIIDVFSPPREGYRQD